MQVEEVMALHHNLYRKYAQALLPSKEVDSSEFSLA
jgi:hypothetical protein